MLDSVADRLLIPRKPGLDLMNEPDLDIHAIDEILSDQAKLATALNSVQGGASKQFRPIKQNTIKGMGSVWDYRRFTQANGGRIKVMGLVEHIPVIRQMVGRADLDVLWRVLRSQGLMVHNATDGEGNVALFVPMNLLCYHARGGNSFLCGTEHMHATILDKWSDKQLNAAAFISYRANEHHDVPRRRGALGPGAGFCTVRKRGHVTHEGVSRNAGFNDRSDPGTKYEALMGEVADRALFFGKHHRF